MANKTKKTTVRFRPAEWQRLKKLAREERRDLAWIIREATLLYLESRAA